MTNDVVSEILFFTIKLYVSFFAEGKKKYTHRYSECFKTSDSLLFLSGHFCSVDKNNYNQENRMFYNLSIKGSNFRFYGFPSRDIFDEKR